MLHNSKKETILKEENEESTLAIYLEDEQIDYIPEKDSGYTLDMTKSSCNNGVTISFDYNTWSVKTNYSNYKNNDNTRVKCSLYFTDKYIELLLNGTDPVLEDPLIPVTIDDDGTVRKADLASEWYDYETKQWANAVILENESKNYASNEIIPEENIESYFVWIPKYRYQLWDLGLYDSLTTIDTNKIHKIPVIFGDYNTSDSVSGECTTPMESGASGNCKVGDYMTHPAFISIPSIGFWVGKFETGYKGANTNTEARKNSRDASKIQIKPNVYSWRSIQVANAFYTSYDYQRNLDSHMMKNTEWGAVAYLSHSAYGSATSVRLNNNSNHLTGYSAVSEPTCGSEGYSYTDCEQDIYSDTCGPMDGSTDKCNIYQSTLPGSDGNYTVNYFNALSTSASTTGNIKGIYDMSGGAWEYMMAVMQDETGAFFSGGTAEQNSGFKGPYVYGGENTTGYDWPDLKYFDRYQYISRSTGDAYSNRILGDATGEMGPFEEFMYLNSTSRGIGSWYNDFSWLFHSIDTYILRGGGNYQGYHAGISAFETNNTGYGWWDRTFRIILTPTR